MPRTFHLVPAEQWEAADPNRPYEAASLSTEGFVHCTDGEAALLATANRHLAEDPRRYLVLTIELEHVGSPWRYDVPGSPYPHVYGPIGRAAIVSVTPIERGPDGRFTAFAGVAAATSTSRLPRAIDGAVSLGDPTTMTDDPDARELDDALDPEVDPREAARDKRRDRDQSAHARALMRTGLAKGFKQILDSQAHRAERAARRDDRSPEAQRPKGKPKDERRRA